MRDRFPLPSQLPLTASHPSPDESAQADMSVDDLIEEADAPGHPCHGQPQPQMVIHADDWGLLLHRLRWPPVFQTTE